MPPNQNAFASNVSLRIALIGQSTFAVDCFHRLRERGHVIVGIFTIPDKGRKVDPLAKVGEETNVPVFKFKSWRKGGKVIEDVFEKYKMINADLNVLPFCSQFIPMEIINYPQYKTIVYHPSLLPRHRGASSINWTLIEGDTISGLTIFWADDGLDTGPILLQEKCEVYENDTVDTLYKRFLYPVGVECIVKAVNMIANGIAPKINQDENFATYEPLLNKKELCQIDWNKKGIELHNFIRGMDSVPGANCLIKIPSINNDDDDDDVYEFVELYGSTIWDGCKPLDCKPFNIKGCNRNGLIHDDGILLTGSDGVLVNIKMIKINGKMKMANKLNEITKQITIDEYTENEKLIIEKIKLIWESILNCDDIDDDNDFFSLGAGSMDVVRLIEEVKDLIKLNNDDIKIDNEDVFMYPTFMEFCQNIIIKLRGDDGLLIKKNIEYKPIEMVVNNIKIKFPCQLFINGEFIDSENPKNQIPIINPTTENLICNVQCATINDVNKAVIAAKKAFELGEWSKISERERGELLLKLSNLMYENREELAIIETIDSGAVYTLALKTHIGMSIETWKYFGGWTDKILGNTIPIKNSRPNKNLTYTKKEPIGVCGIITPWNYPLMMLSWKMAACLAAGNTCIIKPAQQSPLTALKFAELTIKAGIPPGVINILPGTGTITGNAIASHPYIRKLAFTGSTKIGKIIMKNCAETNLKKCSLELGGKSPLIIFSDCDLDKAIKYGMQSVFFNKGENCIAAGRLFVEDKIYNEFIRRVVKETEKIVIGDPLNKSTVHGPQNHLAHLNKLLEFVDIGIKEGAKLELGGKRLNRIGYFFQPTIFSNVQDHMYIAKEESFGPIMCISKFRNGDIDGVLRRANATEYGLASGIFTKDINKALKFAEKIDAGTVFINTYNKTDVAAPFGGFKQSGFGKDLGEEALNEYLKTKCVTIEY